MLSRLAASLLALALVASPLGVIAEEVPVIAEPVPAEVGEPAPEELAPQPEEALVGEILATSTAALVEEEPEPLEEPVDPIDPATYAEGEIIVVFEDEIEEASIEAVESAVETETVETISEEAVMVEVEGPIETAITELAALPEVAYAEPNYLRSVEALPSGTWSLAKVRAAEAQASSTGAGVVVAILDTGIDYTHPDLAGRMWDGSDCVASTSAPIPGGCTHGYDFVDDDADPMYGAASDRFYHGTMVAGVLASVAPDARIMALRIMKDDGTGKVSDETEAIRFAIANGARIVNASYAGEASSEAERAAIAEFEAAGGIFITAAGNDGNDLSETPAYPASHSLDAIVAVAATDETDGLASFSNYGSVAVDLAAPGALIRSLYPGSLFATSSGTSLAAPHVAGAAALLAELGLHGADAKARLMASGDAAPELCAATVSGKRLNALSAVTGVSTDECDFDAPTITLNGARIMELAFAQPYEEPGATAYDDEDGDLTSRIEISGTVNHEEAGRYFITYRVADDAGNEATESREVVVAEKKRRSGGGGGGGKKKDDPVRSVQGGVLGATSPAILESDLAQGATGSEVKKLETVLADFGYLIGGADDSFGADTAAALAAFQRSRGLPETGALDAATRASLNQLSSLLAYLYAELSRLIALKAAG